MGAMSENNENLLVVAWWVILNSPDLILNSFFQNIIAGLNEYIHEEGDDKPKPEEMIENLANYLKERSKFKREHRMWAFRFFICECLNLVNVIGQIFLTDLFLGGEFTTYGIEVPYIFLVKFKNTSHGNKLQHWLNFIVYNIHFAIQ